MSENLGTETITTVFGTEVVASFRHGSNDRDVLQACMVNDEYQLTRILGEEDPENPSVMIDIGCHIGGVTLLAASRGMKVFAFDALQENCELARDNVKLNGWEDRAKVLHYAVCGESCSVRWACYPKRDTASGEMHRYIGNTRKTEIPWDGSHRRMRVATITINEILRDFCRADGCILKMDCEAAEWEIMGAADPAEFGRVKYMIGEVHQGGDYPEMRARLIAPVSDVMEDVTGEFTEMNEHDFVFKRKGI